MKQVTKRVTSYLGCLVFVLGLGVTTLLSSQPANARPNPRRAERVTVTRSRRRPARRTVVRRGRRVRPRIRRTVKPRYRVRPARRGRRIIRRTVRRRPIQKRIIRRAIRRRPIRRTIIRTYPRYRVYPRRTTIVYPGYYRYRNRDYYRGYFWGSLAVGLIRDIIRTQGSTNTVIYQYTPQGEYRALPSSYLESYAKPILDFHGLEASSCRTNSVVLLLPNQQVVCAYPNSEFSDGFYEVHPDSWKLSEVYR